MDDRSILRDLASRVRSIADDPAMPARRRRWIDHNALRSDRPMVLCFPEGAWGEVLPNDALTCKDPHLRGWEWGLRAKIIWWDRLRDDNVSEPWFDLPWQITGTGFGVEIPKTHGENRGSYVWDPPLKNLDRDLDKLKHQSWSVDRAASLANLQRANDLFGDILPARFRFMPWWSVGMTWTAASLVGLEGLMMAMVDEPQNVHRLMAFLRDDTRAYMHWCEREGLLTANNAADYVGSGGVGYTDQLPPGAYDNKPVALRERWGFAESQETVGISPEMFGEFILPYQLELMELSGLNCYGCCEQLETRIDLIMARAPRLRRVSVAPHADQEAMAAKLAGRYVYSRKPKPTPVCVVWDEPAIRADLRRTLRAAGGQPLELILKDTHTVQNEPWRLERWLAIAYEEVEAYLAQTPPARDVPAAPQR